MDILIRNITAQQRAAIETARGELKLQVWGAHALLDAAKYKGPRDFEKKPKGEKPKKAPGKNGAAKAPAKKRVPVRGAAKAKDAASAPARKPKPAAKSDESWRLEAQFRDPKKKRL